MHCVETENDFRRELDEFQPHVVLSDYSMPQFDGMAALDIARECHPEIPFVFVSGRMGEEYAIGALKNGAIDYVLKSNLVRLPVAVERAIQDAKDRAARRKAEAERLQAQQQLQNYAERLQILSRKVIETQESERANIARELHDQLGQTLSAVKLNLQVIQRSTGAQPISHRIDELIQTISETLQQVRTLALEMRPPQLDALGLTSALQSYVERLSATSALKIELIAPPLPTLPSQLDITCFRIVQEALTNVIRHAAAQRVRIELHADADTLFLSVKDDGKGFDPNAVQLRALRGYSMGLLGMEERARLLSGTLMIRSGPGTGSEIHAEFPLSYAQPTHQTGSSISV
jgi:signal transduction histidine kinase